MQTTDLFMSTDMDTTDESGCNGFDAPMFDVLLLNSPADVCGVNITETTSMSYMYSCDNGTLNWYETGTCEGDYIATTSPYDLTCDQTDCDYGVARVYSNDTDDDETCNYDAYTEVPFSMGCTVLNVGLFDISLELFCASDTLNGGDVSANIRFSSTECYGGAPQHYPDVLDAFAVFSTYGFDMDTSCLELKCYQGGFDRFDTPAPTAAPTAEETTDDSIDSAVELAIGVMSSMLVVIGLMK